MIDNRENNHWTVYVHIIPKELSGYDWDKYYVLKLRTRISAYAP